MRPVIIQLGKVFLGCILAFCVEVTLFVAFVVSVTSIGWLMPIALAAIRAYFFPAQIFGRGFDRPPGIHWILLPLFWGFLAYGTSAFIQRVRKRAAQTSDAPKPPRSDVQR